MTHQPGESLMNGDSGITPDCLSVADQGGGELGSWVRIFGLQRIKG